MDWKKEDGRVLNQMMTDFDMEIQVHPDKWVYEWKYVKKYERHADIAVRQVHWKHYDLVWEITVEDCVIVRATRREE